MIPAFLKDIWGYIVAAGVALLSLLIILFQAKKAGKDEVVADTAKKEIADAKTAHDIDENVSTSKPDDVNERLRRFTRD